MIDPGEGAAVPPATAEPDGDDRPTPPPAPTAPSPRPQQSRDLTGHTRTSARAAWVGTGTAGPVSDSDPGRLRHAAEQLLRPGHDNVGDGADVADGTARYRQYALAKVLQSTAQALETIQSVPRELLRHLANLARTY